MRGTFGSSGQLSRTLDELQFTYGQGPCLPQRLPAHRDAGRHCAACGGGVRGAAAGAVGDQRAHATGHVRGRRAAGWLHVLDRIGRTTALRGAAGWLGDALLFVNFLPTTIYRPEVCLATTERAASRPGCGSTSSSSR